MKKRHNQPVSFNLTDAYEKELLAFALKEDHGPFSKYVKRLIDRDRTGKNAHSQHTTIPQTVHAHEEKEAMDSFL